ncbi:3-hydroxyacyl-CoA dehydrogenase NAD-binding domain-containing protein [Trinickia caryophylli]|uniref:3-hydroxyacyl-CoA dehydrogenase n=1 Tax=Trinickia caryophylli TaxID=28094 RepID=A0A1X7DXF2_TRICW|nr:3-hydroxyacyl-CoA dehydrogenase NAD-binding domain-containing protein [Trinickia caryophylli]PMS14227.1 3-hydroxyacyl-CoA dehydrogenase [Trinickia caryophylli]TRX17926.1 3-hydroxyacyl-CoA dehydrogenase [Trinickia caryophylli]WQE11299.1 3-hydroxyacyl-CoA dehydrogenase NAD-binding domain-containing protein [Trinickia caryophylli]SMF22977.1 3-hydroxyacyl-CoA dehydrogenase [Trinickia caryophylli]GLU32449.1 enoyl-CoA hydratase [Trinickia caryophylli]
MNGSQAAPFVTHALDANVLVIRIDHPPVNALSADVRRSLVAAIEEAEANPAVAVALIIGTGRNFIAGADIREFGKPPQPPLLPTVCERIESSTKPVVAAIHGAALGGGLEIALAAHYRIALRDAKLGLPEVNLGLLPGAGGTQRAPRLIGAPAALDLMLSGRHVSGNEALALGLVDRLAASGDIAAEGLAYARELASAQAAPRPTRDAQALARDPTAAKAAIDAARAQIAARSRGLLSPMKIVDAVQAALERPFDEGLALERSAFLECLASPQRAGLVHAFFAEREAAKAPETQASSPRSIERVGIVGGGTMGAGIAVAVLDAGLPIVMIEREEAALAAGRARVERVYEGLVAKGRIQAADKAAALARFTGSTSYEALSDADLVIEAVFEDMSVKKAVFVELDRVARSGAVLATNTSYLDIDEIASATGRPADVIGLHFFSPANVMKLLEIVVPARVAPDVVATAFDFARRLRKVAVRAGVCDGFIGNRLLAVYRTAADYLLEDGASPYQIDGAMRAFGYPMGPYQVVDLAGGDIGWAARKRRAATRDPRARYVEIADRLCERGWFGQKTGRGFYRYEDGARVGKPDPEVEAIVAAERERHGIVPRTFSDEEIVRRLMMAVINEAANVVREGIALRPLDVDVTLVHGYGFPRYRGGPMKYADTLGLANVLAALRRYEREDALFWKPSTLIIELVERGADFSSLDEPRS